MENIREEEEEKLYYTTLNYKMEMKTTLKHCISSALKPPWVFIGTRGKGSQGANPGPKYGRGRTRTAQAAFSRLL